MIKPTEESLRIATKPLNWGLGKSQKEQIMEEKSYVVIYKDIYGKESYVNREGHLGQDAVTMSQDEANEAKDLAYEDSADVTKELVDKGREEFVIEEF